MSSSTSQSQNTTRNKAPNFSGGNNNDNGHANGNQGQGMTRDRARSILISDPAASRLSGHTGIDKFIRESARDAPWNPICGRRT
ncbi:uncharacterized protein CTHT_0056070 [Thermochaetoides thermophila DSM 1495]|uniref:Uncharacterized protein n=1 Tax=Chaetomium thermophilum (strain DSM 1495 / CBS 144.50 / IMI 039719) TaxID=759272 RepID=G0SC62_CHATD|nr:hypothetical protein CTHT_0056070 [Thermochaetoides thermophila DSM 1495]EGS18988.1 hypothetical protein CTHT_0056070 [Thermochaetoides thermophila DSM 1495]